MKNDDVMRPPARAPTSNAYRYYVLAILTIVYVLNFVDRQILAILMPGIKSDLALSDTQLGFLSGLAFAVFYSTVGLPLARFADRSNRRNVIAVCVALWSVMTAVSGLATSFAGLVAARISVGIGEAGGTPPSHSLLSDYFRPERRATAMAIYGTGVPLGILIGLLIGAWLAQRYGWRHAFFAVGLPGVFISLLVWLTLSEPPRSHTEQSRTSTLSVVRGLLAMPSVPHFVMGASLQTFVSYGFSQWAPSFLVRSFGYSLIQAGTALAFVIGCAGALGTLFGGTIADRIAGRDKRWYLWLPAAASFLYAPLIALAYTADVASHATILMVVPVFLSLTYIGPVQALIQTLARPAERATASAALLLTLNLIGLGLGPQIVGIVSDRLSVMFGQDSLRQSLLYVSVIAALWAGVHYLLGARHIRADLSRRELENSVQPSFAARRFDDATSGRQDISQ